MYVCVCWGGICTVPRVRRQSDGDDLDIIRSGLGRMEKDLGLFPDGLWLHRVRLYIYIRYLQDIPSTKSSHKTNLYIYI